MRPGEDVPQTAKNTLYRVMVWAFGPRPEVQIRKRLIELGLIPENATHDEAIYAIAKGLGFEPNPPRPVLGDP